MPDAPASAADQSVVRDVLATAVEALGGAERSGQVAMAEAVADSFSSGEHLLVQAGTGTGKSLAYLVPALVHDKRVVVATATLALQHQLVERDLPRLVEAVKGVAGVDTSYAVLKGRSNYACLHRILAASSPACRAIAACLRLPAELPVGIFAQGDCTRVATSS